MASFQELARKKVAGVPVIYLAGGFVVILAIVAWKMKSSSAPEEPTGDESTTTDNVPGDSDEATDLAGDYSGLKTTGTVIVAPQQTTAEEAVKETNESWERSAITYLMTQKYTAGDAQTGINKYLGGEDLTFAQGQMRDAAISKLGLPPEPLSGIGQTGSAPAQKQFTNFPGKHTVRGTNDNTPYRLALLYYGTAGSTPDASFIVAANPQYGPVTTTYNVGTVVTIPAKIPNVFITTTKDMRYFSSIASKNGISQGQVAALNPGLANPAAIGVKVRVR